MRLVQRVMTMTAAALLAAAPQALAQAGFVNMVDHIHLAVPDQPKE